MSDSRHITLQMDKLDNDKSLANNQVSLISFTFSTEYIQSFLHSFTFINSSNLKVTKTERKC